jgi:hypothetical protein
MSLADTTAPNPADSADDDGAFSVGEFCRRYNISRTAFYEELNGGRIAAKKRGWRTLVPRANARAWFNSLPDANAPA